MGRTACTEPQCLYKGALYLYLIDAEITLPLPIELNILHSLEGQREHSVQYIYPKLNVCCMRLSDSISFN
jgi:hypothetical protein